jgi:DNA-binding MarR family transcriptional regulator
MNESDQNSDQVPDQVSGQVPDIPLRDFRRALRLLERQIERTLAFQTGCCGVTVAQCHLLLELDQEESAGSSVDVDGRFRSGPGIGIGDCARALELDASTLSRTVDSLVRAGLVSREVDANNRRRQIVSLTEAGRDRAADIHRLCDSYYARILDSLPAGSRKPLAEGIAALAAALRDQPFDGCAPATDALGQCCGTVSRATDDTETEAGA